MNRYEKQPPHPGIIAVCTMVLLLAACSSTLHIEHVVPQPLVGSLPLNAGVCYDDRLRQFTFARAADHNSAAWDIALGEAQVHLFDQVLQRLFDKLVEVDSVDSTAATTPLAIVMQPSIDEYILMTPLDTSTSDYEVTIRYSLAFYTPAGELINRWSFSGYGKQRGVMLSNDDIVRKATVAAMRDAAAWLVVEFTRNAGIDALLQARQSDNEIAPPDQDS